MLSFSFKRKTNWSIAFLTGFWTLAVWTGTVLVLYGCFTDNRFDRFPLMMPFLIVSLFTLKRFLWQVRGAETVILSEEHLLIKKSGTIFSIPVKYSINDIDSFNIINKSNTPFILKAYGVSGGKISFDYRGSAKYFGQTLNNNEASRIVDALYAELSRIKQ